MFQTYKISQAERVSIIKSWLGRQGLQLIESLTQAEQEMCNTEEGLFEIFNNKFKPQCNETIVSAQFCSLTMQTNENTEGWIGRIRVVVIECTYKELVIY